MCKIHKTIVGERCLYAILWFWWITMPSASLAVGYRDDLPQPPNGSHWTRSFADEFDGTSVDTSVWRVNGDYRRAGGWWLRRLVQVDGSGHLHLSRAQYFGAMATGGIESRGKRNWLYGYFVARIKLPELPAGHRPAFWLKEKGANNVGLGGVDGAEIDVFEAPGGSGKIDHNIHWDMNNRLQLGVNWVHRRSPIVITYGEWHSFGVWWTPASYTFYVDGKMSWTTSAGGVSQVPLAMLLTDEALETDPLRALHYNNARRGGDLLIDYVRVYQLTPDR